MHKKIGILGGLSPESTGTYYKYITREYTKRYVHYNYPEIIIEATAEGIEREGVKTVGLLGTIFTMSRDFYKAGLEKREINMEIKLNETVANACQ